MIQYLNVFYDIYPTCAAQSFWWAAGCATITGSTARLIQPDAG